MSLAYSPSLNDDTVLLIARCCCNLTDIDLQGCIGVTDNAMRCVLILLGAISILGMK